MLAMRKARVFKSGLNKFRLEEMNGNFYLQR